MYVRVWFLFFESHNHLVHTCEFHISTAVRGHETNKKSLQVWASWRWENKTSKLQWGTRGSCTCGTGDNNDLPGVIRVTVSENDFCRIARAWVRSGKQPAYVLLHGSWAKRCGNIQGLRRSLEACARVGFVVCGCTCRTGDNNDLPGIIIVTNKGERLCAWFLELGYVAVNHTRQYSYLVLVDRILLIVNNTYNHTVVTVCLLTISFLLHAPPLYTCYSVGAQNGYVMCLQKWNHNLPVDHIM